MNEEVNSDNNNKVTFKTVYKIPQQVNLFRNISYDLVKTILKDVVSLCGVQRTKSWDPIKKILHPLIDDILLIVVFNYNNVYNSLGFNEYLHRQYFKYIIYCVPSVSNFQNYSENTGFHYVSFIEGLADEGWYFFYQCVSAAMKLDLPVNGYLQIGDDVLLNSWNILTIPRNEMMVFSEEKYVDLYKDDADFQWDYWETGQKDIQNVIAELEKLSSGNKDFSKAYPLVNVTYFATEFLQNLKGNLEPNFVAYGATDIFYVPKVLKNEYITASELFRKHHCMVELALRNIYLGLKRPREQKFLFEGHALWDDDRKKPWIYFNGVNDTFIHPYKWLRDAWKKEGRRFACRRYLPLHSLRKPS
ncbi:glycosyltransferase STELLO2 isoform X1 [Biomphalaria pfeifferi]|uniref:Glycosyltransferase STELLO2 isoform X1 n=1 Tax=Biomphalaria pfeifferi TaxID=112525 RepID=A0AAD8C3R2_BIOPF|nr:glycosyltransferase STELLO2 isoform X1 [Biomphalaria pfeifferi]